MSITPEKVNRDLDLSCMLEFEGLCLDSQLARQGKILTVGGAII